MRTNGELKRRLLAIPEGGSAVFDGVSEKRVRTACWRMRNSGLPYNWRWEGTERDKSERLVVYHGPLPSSLVTRRNGVRSMSPRGGTARRQWQAGVRASVERWFGYDLVGLIRDVDRGYKRFCAKRGLDPSCA